MRFASKAYRDWIDKSINEYCPDDRKFNIVLNKLLYLLVVK